MTDDKMKVRDVLVRGLEKAGADAGMGPAEMAGTVLGSVLTSTLALRAARRGDVARTVLYGLIGVSRAIEFQAKRTRVTIERQAGLRRG